MKKNEAITLGVGVAAILIFLFIGGVFTMGNSNSNTHSTVMDNKSTPIPEVTGTDITKDPKVKITEVQVGTGTVATTNSHVYVHYTGRLEDGTVFDSSLNRGVPFDFILGQGKVIKGWDLGLQGMKVGGKRRLVIDPDYGYGSAGYPPVIPGNAKLIFDVALVNVKAK